MSKSANPAAQRPRNWLRASATVRLRKKRKITNKRGSGQ